MYYELLSDGTIGRSTPSQKVAQSLGLTLETDREIVYGHDGKRYFKGDEPVYEPTDDEQRQNRAAAYQAEVDPITAHIERLRDEAEIDAAKIAELITERTKKVEEIKQKFPYKNGEEK